MTWPQTILLVLGLFGASVLALAIAAFIEGRRFRRGDEG
jgi:hypothetical protein